SFRCGVRLAGGIRGLPCETGKCALAAARADRFSARGVVAGELNWVKQMINRLFGLPPNASQHGYLIDNMLETCHWFMLLLAVGWSIFFVYTLIRSRMSRNPQADYHGAKTKASTHIEFMVVLIEAVLLLGFV